MSFLAVSLLFSSIAFSAPGASDVTGNWKGTLDVGQVKLHLLFKITKSADGSLSAKMDSLDQGAKGIPANAVRFTAPNAHLEWQTIAGTFDGKVENGKLSGIWKQGGAEFPLVFERSTAN